MRMELPPGWRGYGAKDYIDHPDTPRAARPRWKRSRSSTPTIASRCSKPSCPYADLLPARLRGRNERIDEPLADAVRPAA